MAGTSRGAYLRPLWSLVIAFTFSSSLMSCADSERPASERRADSVDATHGAWCDVKAVLDEHCTACHDGEGSAGTPMGLVSYEDLRAKSAAFPGTPVYERVLARIHDKEKPMPPQGGLSAREKALFENWVASGAPGDARAECGGDSASPAAETEDDWPADCERFYEVRAHAADDPEKPYVFPANTEDHPQFYFDAPWGDEPVQALAMRPITDNKKILHHWILYQNSGGSAFLTGWSPGKDKRERMPDDVGMFLPSGARSLRLDMHYYNLGADTLPEADASGVRICVVGKDKFRTKTATVFMGFTSLGSGFPPVLAPANSVNHSVTANCMVTASEPVHLLTASPHAHKLANHMRFTVRRADGSEIVMHDGDFNFEEQQSYALPEQIVLNTGDVVSTTCTYTNKTNQNVSFGENTGNEMCFNFAVYYPMGALSCGGGLLGGGGLGGLLGGFGGLLGGAGGR